jgi:hypothetical protein
MSLDTTLLIFEKLFFFNYLQFYLFVSYQVTPNPKQRDMQIVHIVYQAYEPRIGKMKANWEFYPHHYKV